MTECLSIKGLDVEVAAGTLALHKPNPQRSANQIELSQSKQFACRKTFLTSLTRCLSIVPLGDMPLVPDLWLWHRDFSLFTTDRHRIGSVTFLPTQKPFSFELGLVAERGFKLPSTFQESCLHHSDLRGVFRLHGFYFEGELP